MLAPAAHQGPKLRRAWSDDDSSEEIHLRDARDEATQVVEQKRAVIRKLEKLAARAAAQHPSVLAELRRGWIF